MPLITQASLSISCTVHVYATHLRYEITFSCKRLYWTYIKAVVVCRWQTTYHSQAIHIFVMTENTTTNANAFEKGNRKMCDWCTLHVF